MVLMLCVLSAGCIIVLVALTYLSSSYSDGGFGNVLIFSIFPLVIVVLIGFFNRAQERINVRGGIVRKQDLASSGPTGHQPQGDNK